MPRLHANTSRMPPSPLVLGATIQAEALDFTSQNAGKASSQHDGRVGNSKVAS